MLAKTNKFLQNGEPEKQKYELDMTFRLIRIKDINPKKKEQVL